MTNKKKIAIITDSSNTFQDLKHIDKDVFVMPCVISDENQNSYLDNKKGLEKLNLEQKLNGGEILKTAAPIIGASFQLFESVFEKYEYVIAIVASKELTSIYNQMLIIKDDYEEKMFVIDTATSGFGLEFLTTHALSLIKKGLNVEDVVAGVQSSTDKVSLYFSCMNPANLLKSGRSPKAMAIVCKVFSIKPIICLDGKNKLVGASIGFDKSINKCIELLKEAFGSWNNNLVEQICFMGGFIEKKYENKFVDLLAQKFEFKKENIKMRSVPTVVLSHTSVNSFGICVITKKAKDRVDEKIA